MEIINVKYKYIDGAHFFLGEDDLSEGLCVAHADLKTAFDAVATELAFLLKANYQKTAEVFPGSSFEAFKSWVDKVHGTATNGIEPIPSGKLKWSNTSQPTP